VDIPSCAKVILNSPAGLAMSAADLRGTSQRDRRDARVHNLVHLLHG
jgi:hypothetical protein